VDIVIDRRPEAVESVHASKMQGRMVTLSRPLQEEEARQSPFLTIRNWLHDMSIVPRLLLIV
jgi:hypothetical protein